MKLFVPKIVALLYALAPVINAVPSIQNGQEGGAGGNGKDHEIRGNTRGHQEKDMAQEEQEEQIGSKRDLTWSTPVKQPVKSVVLVSFPLPAPQPVLPPAPVKLFSALDLANSLTSPVKLPKLPVVDVWPIYVPTKTPTKRPTKVPTKKPTKLPTKAPTKKPTKAPTKKPTKAPTKTPTKAPTKKPTKTPTNPVKSPTYDYTEAPTTYYYH